MEPNPWRITIVRDEAYTFTPEQWAEVEKALAEIDSQAEKIRAGYREYVWPSS
jgi:hypothetical protein